MAELRRLLIDQTRLKSIVDVGKPLLLSDSEFHYLKRVLRLRKGDPFAVIDGFGNLWEAIFNNERAVLLTTIFDNPLQTISRSNPLICLAVVVPKKGFDDVLRMSTEIGIDIIQPLISERSSLKNESMLKTKRWKTIISEAVEQSERLWCPQLLETIYFRDFISSSSSFPLGIATTRLETLKDCHSWLNEIVLGVEQIWIAIGPEGGWTSEEVTLAISSGCEALGLGDTILRTSTAAIVASQYMTLSRRNLNN